MNEIIVFTKLQELLAGGMWEQVMLNFSLALYNNCVYTIWLQYEGHVTLVCVVTVAAAHQQAYNYGWHLPANLTL